MGGNLFRSTASTISGSRATPQLEGRDRCRDRLGCHDMKPAPTNPTFDALRNLALALGTSADKFLFEPNERGPANDLLLAFEAASTRLDQEGQDHLKATLEGLLLRAETRRWAS
jgi:hypothetical protein